MVEPNVIPLVDIMLVLLIIMIITVPVMTQAVKIDLPKEINRPTDTKPENINVSIDFDGSIYWNESSVDRAQMLNLVLAEAVKDRSGGYIRAEAGLRGRGATLAGCSGRMRKVGLSPSPAQRRLTAAGPKDRLRRHCEPFSWGSLNAGERR
jgi:biopolymer transport protein ExbD